MRLAVLLLLLALAAPAKAIEGRVFLDQNGSARHDDGEPGIAGVRVSNGRDIVGSDAQGRYAIDLRDGDTLFVIKPAGYLPELRDGVPQFWQHQFPEGSPALRYGGLARQQASGEFALRSAEEPEAPMELLVFGDPQPKSMTDVGYYERDIVTPIIGKHAAELGISLGDEVSDDLSLYPAMNRITARLNAPWLHVSGNHDLDFDAARDQDSLLTFRATYGPETYAWETRYANFLVLDDVLYQPDQAQKYVGGLREDQFAFIEKYLKTVDPKRLLVIAAHIPFFDTLAIRGSFRPDHRERLFALLSPLPQVLLLTAHAHTQQHYFHGVEHGWQGKTPLHEFNVGATCGGFWSGVFDAAGIPETTMADGTPNGYATLRIQSDARYALRYRVARAEDDPQIALFPPGPVRQGAYPAFAVFANVFMGAPDMRVEFRIDAQDWQAMQRLVGRDPRVISENLRDAQASELRGYDRAVEAEDSTHLWRGTVPTDIASGEHRIEVRAFDRWIGELRAATSYTVVDEP